MCIFCLIGLVNGKVAVQNGAMCELPPEVGQRLVLARAIFQHGTSISCLVPVNSLFMEDA